MFQKDIPKQIVNIVMIMMTKKPKNCIICLDMNNLYGHAMSQYLPYGGFKCFKNTDEIINKILNKRDDSLHGHFLEVDLE